MEETCFMSCLLHGLRRRSNQLQVEEDKIEIQGTLMSENMTCDVRYPTQFRRDVLPTLHLLLFAKYPGTLDVVDRQHINNVSDEPQWTQLSKSDQSELRNEALLELVQRYKVPDIVRRWPAAFHHRAAQGVASVGCLVLWPVTGNFHQFNHNSRLRK